MYWVCRRTTRQKHKAITQNYDSISAGPFFFQGLINVSSFWNNFLRLWGFNSIGSGCSHVTLGLRVNYSLTVWPLRPQREGCHSDLAQGLRGDRFNGVPSQRLHTRLITNYTNLRYSIILAYHAAKSVMQEKWIFMPEQQCRPFGIFTKVNETECGGLSGSSWSAEGVWGQKSG